ncbi:RNA-binding domain-containing protein [Streptomyces microflavus]|uniref:RNA-binding domain-containing protein n=1 Tax=Streptomyces microflavus TaxID=1919 RepID=UPI0038055DF6
MDLKSALAALDAQEPLLLLGLRETQWLDAKGGPYQLSHPRSVEELAKDVAAFANGGGGLIVIGIATRRERDEEVLDHIVEVVPATVNLDQIRKLIRQWITPAPRGVRVEWSGGEGERVVFISVPEQAVDTLFVVPPPVGKHGSPRTDTVAVPVRDGDGTHWLPRTEIQQLLSAGVRATGMPTAQALTELVRQAVSEAGPDGGLRVGQGLPDREREMRAAYEQLAGQGLGRPAGEAWAQGAAACQDLHHERDGEPGWVLCLVAGRPAVAVAAPVWQAIVEAGQRSPGPDPLAAIGFPRPHEDTGVPGVIAADARSVDVDGGSWGAGRLTCSGRGVWRWQPLPRFSVNQGRSAGNWTAGQTPALRLRAVVNLPWAGAGTLEISRPQRAARIAASVQRGGRGSDDPVQAPERRTARRTLGTGSLRQLGPLCQLRVHDRRAGRRPGSEGVGHVLPAHHDGAHRGGLLGRSDREPAGLGGCPWPRPGDAAGLRRGPGRAACGVGDGCRTAARPRR